MTGWRVGEILALRWAEVDLKTGYIVTTQNKGDRVEGVTVAPLVLEHLSKLRAAFGQTVFPCECHERTLYDWFDAIQEAAEVKPPRKKHYTFHDFRRGFATNNVRRLKPEDLQALMRHKSAATTKGYIGMVEAIERSAVDVFHPDLKGKPKKADGA
jgi:integrase